MIGFIKAKKNLTKSQAKQSIFSQITKFKSFCQIIFPKVLILLTSFFPKTINYNTYKDDC